MSATLRQGFSILIGFAEGAYLKRLLNIVVVASMIAMFGCSAGSTTGGVYLEEFDVTGQWAGQIGDGNVLRDMTMSINDTDGTVNANIIVTNHTCLSGATTSAATAAPADKNAEGDNPITSDQETSNEGDLTMTFTVTVGEDELNLNFILNGNSASQTGNYNGFWYSQPDQFGSPLEIPGFPMATCRGGISGPVTMVKLSK